VWAADSVLFVQLASRVSPQIPIAWVLICASLIATPVRADVYFFTDERGVVHFTNVPDDPRYKLYMRWRESFRGKKRVVGTTPAVSGKELESRRKRYSPVVDAVAHSYQLESALLHAVISAESAYNPYAVSRKGAMGLMQLMPETAQRYGVSDRQDPMENLRGGAQYLRDLLQLFNDDLSLAVAAYNAGEGAVLQYGNRIPPFPETRTYVSRVLDYYQRYRRSIDRRAELF
jgi:soluble lytic murein transglycosylase-like protein